MPLTKPFCSRHVLEGVATMNTKTKGILAYLLIAFGGAWTVWVLLWLLGVSPTRTSLQFQLLSLPAECAPAIAAVIVLKALLLAAQLLIE
jgi:hypothetical protein